MLVIQLDTNGTIDRSTSRYVFFIDIERHRDDRLASVISDELDEQVKHDKSFYKHLNQENATLLRKPKVFHPKRKYDRHTTSQGIWGSVECVRYTEMYTRVGNTSPSLAFPVEIRGRK